MKKVLYVMAAVGAFAMAGMAQSSSYAGTWTLDASKSNLDGRMRNIESMTLTVTQSEKSLSVTTATKRAENPNAGASRGTPPAGMQRSDGGMGGGGRGLRGFGGGDGTVTYSLDGKEVKSEAEGPMGKIPVTYKGSKESDGSLKLSNSRTFEGPNGEMTITTKETWKLSADGKTLTIERETTSFRGPNSSTLVFNRG